MAGLIYWHTALEEPAPHFLVDAKQAPYHLKTFVLIDHFRPRLPSTFRVFRGFHGIQPLKQHRLTQFASDDGKLTGVH